MTAEYEIRKSRSIAPDFGAPGYEIIPTGGPHAGVPVGWADTQLGAAGMAMGAQYVQARLENDAAKIAAAELVITDFLAALR